MSNEEISVPTVHNNGSGEKNLTDQCSAVREALRIAMEAMRQASPHGRDYYTQKPGAFEKARSEHVARITKIQSVIDDTFAIHLAIVNQGRG